MFGHPVPVASALRGRSVRPGSEWRPCAPFRRLRLFRAEGPAERPESVPPPRPPPRATRESVWFFWESTSGTKRVTGLGWTNWHTGKVEVE